MQRAAGLIARPDERVLPVSCAAGHGGRDAVGLGTSRWVHGDDAAPREEASVWDGAAALDLRDDRARRRVVRDGGGRLPVELCDLDADEVRIGAKVEMTFRRLSTADGIPNYFWKARLVREPAAKDA